ncbi:hypothetical protein DFQ26_001051 [Actinomortierella ambigua]|nr:hypothetical protein DFQ26_001051 [Actinomortierella ambigua]
MQKFSGHPQLRLQSAKASAALGWTRGTGQSCQQTVLCKAHFRINEQQLRQHHQRRPAFNSGATCPLQQQRQQQQHHYHYLSSRNTPDSVFQSFCQRRFLARSTRPHLRTTAASSTASSSSSSSAATTAAATASSSPRYSAKGWHAHTGLGYVHPHLMRNFRKKDKFVFGVSNTDDGPAASSSSSFSNGGADADSATATKFAPRPTGRITEELGILCAALRRVGARQVFTGPNIHIVDTPKSCADALALIQEYYQTVRGEIGAVGFDSETTVYRTWDSSPNKRTSILQIATEDVCLIVQLFYMTGKGKNPGAIPEILREFLKDPKQVKVGVGIASDAEDLSKSYGLQIAGLVDLAQLASQKGFTPASMSLVNLDDKFGSEDWSVVKTSDIYYWDFDQQMLHRDAIWYSAIDALSCKAIYENLQRGSLKSTYVPWEKRFPMTPQQEYKDIIQFLHFKIKPNKLYPIESIKILLTKSYPRLKQIHPPEKVSDLADIYISKMLKDGALVVDENFASKEELQLTADEIISATHPGLALRLATKDGATQSKDPQQPLTNMSSPQAASIDNTSTMPSPPKEESAPL